MTEIRSQYLLAIRECLVPEMQLGNIGVRTMESAAGVGAKTREVDEFNTRAIMSLVMESSEMMETARRIAVIVSALALAHGISTDV